ncbi:MAG: CHASE3 domain-containing protein, partial [Burkholderiales bacterium]
MKWTVGTKIGAGYALALVILVIFGAVSYRNTAELIEAIQMRARTHEILQNLDGVLSALQNAETGQRGYVITGEERYLEPYQTGTAMLNQTIQNLRRLTADNPNLQRRPDAVESLAVGKIGELKETIDLRRSEGFD